MDLTTRHHCYAPGSLPRALAAALLLLASSCGVVDSDPLDPLRIRVRNATGQQIDEIRLLLPADTLRFESVAPGETTGYRGVQSAYEVMYMEVLIGGERIVHRPRDYMGVDLLDPGSYTLKLTRLPPAVPTNLGVTIEAD